MLNEIMALLYRMTEWLLCGRGEICQETKECGKDVAGTHQSVSRAAHHDSHCISQTANVAEAVFRGRPRA